MVDGHDKQDRVLVRPYVKKDDREDLPAAPATDPRSSAETQVIPVAEPPPPPAVEAGATREERDRRGVLLLVGGALALILATVAVVVAIWPRDHGPAEVLPATNPVWPAGTAAPSAAASVARASSSLSASPSRSASASPSASASASATSAAPSSAPSASSTSAGPPAARSGAITAAGGHCLDAKGQIALLGSSLSIYDCNSSLSQTWTVATDGTLRVAGMCAAATGDTSVHISTCGADDDARWLSGSGSTLVNRGTGGCLTDPTGGSRTGSSLKLAACGGSGQKWSLP